MGQQRYLLCFWPDAMATRAIASSLVVNPGRYEALLLSAADGRHLTVASESGWPPRSLT